MKRFLLSAALALSPVVMAMPAHAAPITFTTGDISSGSFGRSGIAKGTFTDTLTFTVPKGDFAGSATNTAIKIGGSGDIDWSAVSLISSDGTTIFNLTGSNVSNGDASIVNIGPSSVISASTALEAGTYTLSLTGKSFSSSGSYGGQTSFVASAVPEPAAWGLMIAGFGMVGFALRRRIVRVPLLTFRTA